MLRSWIYVLYLGARPKTLMVSIIPIALGNLYAWYYATWNVLDAMMMLATALCLQISTNFINDAMDFYLGADTAHRVGEQRLSQSGQIDASIVFKMGCLFLGLAVILGVKFVLYGGVLYFVLGASSLLCAYAYTGKPFLLAYRGLGEILVFIFFGYVAVLGSFYWYCSIIPWQLFLVAFQMGLLASVIIAINNLRDCENDLLADKKTLAVRLGERVWREVVCWMVVVQITSSLGFILGGWVFPGLGSWMSAGIGYSLWRELKIAQGSMLNHSLKKAVQLLVVQSVFHGVGVILQKVYYG